MTTDYYPKDALWYEVTKLFELRSAWTASKKNREVQKKNGYGKKSLSPTVNEADPYSKCNQLTNGLVHWSIISGCWEKGGLVDQPGWNRSNPPILRKTDLHRSFRQKISSQCSNHHAYGDILRGSDLVEESLTSINLSTLECYHSRMGDRSRPMWDELSGRVG